MESQERSPSSEPGNRRENPVPRFVDIVVLGTVLGICHTVAETTLLGWYGVRLGLFDILVFAAVYGALGGVLGAVLFVGVWMKCKTTRRAGRLITSAGGNGFFFVCVILGEGIIGTKLVIDHASGIRLGMILGPFLAALVVLAVFLVRQWESPTATVFALLTLSFAAVGATLAASRLGEVPLQSMRIKLCASLCVLPTLGLVVLTVMNKRQRARSGARARTAHMGRAIIVAGLALACNMGLWTWLWPVHMRWHVDLLNPTANAFAKGKPNVLLLVMDTVRSQSMDLFGYERETMPFLRKFAQTECDHVAEMFANASSTLPTHASMFTGHFSHSHGAHKPLIVDKNPPVYAYSLNDQLPTLAEWLSQAGYQTAAFPANYGVLSAYGLSRGFGYYDCRESAPGEIRRISWLFAFTLADNSLGNFIQNHLLPDGIAEATLPFNPWLPHYRRIEEINDLAFEWLASRKSAPFFLFLNCLDAHDPYVAPPKYRNRFGKRDPRIDWIGFPIRLFNRLLRDGIPVPKLDVDYARDQYDAELVYLDEQIERLLQHLRRIGCYENTLVIIASDHGEGFMEHGIMRHSATLYDTQTSVPLLIKLPATVKNPVPDNAGNMQHVDFLPTILEVLDIDPPAGLQGSPWGTGRDYALSEIFSRYRNHPKFHRELFAVRMDDFKYIRSTSGEEELYDMAADPHETRNLIGTMPQIEQRAKAIARQRDERLTGKLLKGNEDKGLIDRLRSLGYVE